MAITEAQNEKLCLTFSASKTRADEQFKRYADLVFVVSILLVVAVAATVGMLFWDADRAGVVTAGLATAASAGGLKFVTDQREYYQNLSNEAARKMETYCTEDVRRALL
jgi:hypothetical protein